MQTSIFDIIYPKFKIDKKIRLITLFSGYDSQALALKYLDIDFEHYKTCEWAVKSIQALKDLHFENDTIDYSKDLSKEQLIEKLFNKGISADYNKSMTLDQIKRLSENQLRTIYNNIKATHNLVNIQQVKGSDLEIKDTNKYCYIMTYSFPCQDLSLAGNRKGMSDTSTRSGMLWEVERILTELKERPQVLIMENVVQVHGEGNVNDFNKWQLRLEELGYRNYWEDLIATDYGIPQTRNRCFMVSILGDYSYSFPAKQPLKLRLKDMLEDNVDEKYYLSDKQIQDIQSWNAYEKPLENMEKTDKNNISPTLTTRSGAYAAGMILVKDKDSKIRKLTPREFFRLMGVNDEDYEKVVKNQSNASLYHLAGDSLITTIMMALFSQMLDINWQKHFNSKEWWNNE
jgi:DNA (cytosine-5)-methyltransferase 1